MSVEILSCSPLCTLQDAGRVGASAVGLSQSGAADEFAFYAANMLLQNPPNAPMLEIAFGNSVFKALASFEAVVTGAKVSLHVEEKPVPLWQTFRVEKGQRLRLGMAESGQWVYVAFKGAMDAPLVFGSASTSVKEGIGGQRFWKGDRVEFAPQTLPHRARLKGCYVPDFAAPLTLRVVLGYQEAHFAPEEKARFFEGEYTITKESNRMGYRLEGPAVGYGGGGIISEGIAFGAVQIPPHGQPIVLLKERQSIGGYPKIGSVLGVDCFALAQRPAGAKVRFAPISMEEGASIMREFYGAMGLGGGKAR